MAIYRSDQATITFAPEVGQGGYMESGDNSSFTSTGLGVATAVVPGDRSVTLTGSFSPSSGANLKTFIAIGNNTYLSGPKEVRRVVSGFGTTTVTVDTPFGFPHPVIGAGADLVEYLNTAADGTADSVSTDDKGKFITWLPGVFESVDCPDPEQAFEPRYILGNLTNRNFYQMYAGQETLSGSIGGMIMLNGFPLRFPLGKVVTTPVAAASDTAWDLAADTKAGDTFISIDRTGNATIAAGTYILFGVTDGTTVPSGNTHQSDSTKVYEIRQVVTAVSSSAAATLQVWPPLAFPHTDNDDLYSVPVSASTEFLHTIFEQVALTPVTWNVSLVDDANTNIWQRRYVGGKIGSMTLSAESGGLLTGGWDGVNFLDMIHNVKSHPSLPANQPMPRYASMQSITSTKVGKYNSSGTFDRPTTSPYYFSQGIVKMFNNEAADGTALARLQTFNLSISNSPEPKYYVGAQFDGRRTPKEQFEGQREYTMSATLATNDSADKGTEDVADLFRELLLAGDYRGSGGLANTFRGFGIELKFIRDLSTLGATPEKDYIKITIPNDGTAAGGGNEQGAFIRTAPHNISDANPLTADADIVFRSMKIDIRDYEPIYP